MKTFLILFSLFAVTAHAEKPMRASTCEWNVIINSGEALLEVQKLLHLYTKVVDSQTAETGVSFIQAYFNTQEFKSRKAAEIQAVDVMHQLNSLPGITAVCMVDHMNKNPRITGAN